MNEARGVARQVMESNLAAIVLAAGKGTRMCSERAKVLHEVAGEPMIAHAIRCLVALGPRPLIVVIGNQAAEVEAAARSALTGNQLSFATQEHQRGTGDAARAALAKLPAEYHGPVLITYGDTPALRASTLAAFVDEHRRRRAPFSLISVNLDEPRCYGRVIRGRDGGVEAIVEARDATAAQRVIHESNMGLYLVDADLLRSALAELKPNNVQGEYYLTDLVAIANRRGLRVEAVAGEHVSEFSGINSREELAQMEAEIRAETNRKLMASGVTMLDPATAYIGPQVQIGRDTVIGPNVQIMGNSRIGSRVRIEGTAFLVDVTIGDGCHIKLGVRAEKCVMGPDCEIGPFANLREGTDLEGHNRIGNFVETKKARLGRGTKASHLSYLGDATIGRETNVGCGVITVNYDGYDKHLTEIGDRCMVGCDTQLIAPVKVGNDVYVASGTTIVREVEDGALVMSHHPQREKPGWMAGFHKRHSGRAPWWEKE